ncbi:hypothetical protein [Bradyrhizobium oligotrophicum]|uniref:hypothetical protein n=1 Tax=Bradyrhizobium TaxID=374 RepID=UPI003EC0A9C2
MNQVFADRVGRVQQLFDDLDRRNVLPLVGTIYPEIPAVYVFVELGKPVHVGRTSKLRQRIRGHRDKSHYSATFAFKEARRLTNNLRATYKAKGSRTYLMQDPDFRAEFDRQIRRVTELGVKYLEVEDAIDQYLLELYAALEYQTSLTEFENH